MIKGIHHVGLSVRDIDRSLVFYRDALGMEVESRNTFSGERYETIMGLKGAHGTVAVLKRPNLEVELFEFSYPQPNQQHASRPVCDHGITHFCITVEDIDHEYERLKAAGARPHCSPIDFGTATTTYVRDPDGNVLELLELTPEALQAKGPSGSGPAICT